LWLFKVQKTYGEAGETVFYLLAKFILRIFFYFTGGVKADGLSNVFKCKFKFFVTR